MFKTYQYIFLVLFLLVHRLPIFAQQQTLPTACELQVFLPVAENSPVDDVFKKSQSFLIHVILGVSYEALLLVSRDKTNQIITKPEGVSVSSQQVPAGLEVGVQDVPCQSGVVTVSGHSTQLNSLDAVITGGIFSYDFPIPMRKNDDFIYIDVVGRKILKFPKEVIAESCELDVTLPFGNGQDDTVSEDGSPAIESFAVRFPLVADWDAEDGPKDTGMIIVNKEQSKPLVSHPDKMSASLTKNVKEGTGVLSVKVKACYSYFITIAAYTQTFKSLEELKNSKELSLLRFDGMSAVKEHKEDEVMGKLFINAATKEIKAEMKKKGKHESISAVTIWEEPVKKDGLESPAKTEASVEIPITIEKPAKFRNTSAYKNNLVFHSVISGYRFIPDGFVSADGYDYLYLATGLQETLEILDASDVDSIRRVSSFFTQKTPSEKNKTTNGRLWYSQWSKVKVVNNTVYVLNRGQGVKEDLLVIDVSDKSSPKLLSVYDTKGEPEGIFVRDNTVYLATQKDFQILDASNPKSLRLMGSYKFNVEKDADIFEMDMAQDHAFICGYKMGTLILNVSDPKKIALVSKIEAKNYAVSLQTYNDYLFLSEMDIKGVSSQEVKIFDIREAASPKLIHSISFEKQEGVKNVLVSDDKLYVSLVPLPIDDTFMEKLKNTEFNSLKVFDVSDMMNPKLVDGYAAPQAACLTGNVIKEDKYLYVSTSCGLVILKSKD